MKVASIATYRERLDVLPDAIKSLESQVDIIHVYFNESTDKDFDEAVLTMMDIDYNHNFE